MTQHGAWGMGHWFTFEFRHQSWLIPPVCKLLERAGAAICLPVSPTVALDICLTAPWTYIRAHSGQWGTGYSDEELSVWAGRIRSNRAQGADVCIYFNNDPDGHAIRDAQRPHALLQSG